MVRANKMKITPRIWILIIVVLLSLISIFGIPPQVLEKGLLITSINQNSTVFQDGLRQGMTIQSINGQEIKSMEDYAKAMTEVTSLGENQTIKLTIQAKEIEIINLYDKTIVSDISLHEIPLTRIKTGLDLRGGARAFVKADVPLNDAQLNDLIAVSEQRLNIYGLSDVKFFKVGTSSGENLMGIEIAGSSPEDLEELIAKQGHFEAKIGNDTVFIGGDKDITHVGRTGQDAMITECFAIEGGEACNFQFTIFLSEEAAQRLPTQMCFV
jgi:membrane-associated protease RseP (regulator of RpoE activity)